MDTQVYLIRHGETEWNASGKYQGCTDIALSKEGILQAEYLKERIDKSFHCIYTSPLKRAVDTARIISKNTGITPIISNELREINFGEWEGLTIREIKNKYSKEFNNWKTDETSADLVGGDLSLKNASIRARNEILRIVKENKGKKIIIVAHGGIIKAGLLGIFQWKMTMYHKLALGNTSVSRLCFDNNLNASLITLNDTSHLPSEYVLKSYV
jgi:probable phosphoglycerate mutase